MKKCMLVTGAAQGIGLAVARRYAGKGWFVGLYDLNGEGVEQLLGSGEFPAACGGHCDVTNTDSLRAMFDDFSMHTEGRLDLFVNNAGVLAAGEFTDIAAAQHDLIVDVNIRGATHALQLAFPMLKNTPGAAVVNLCSASSIHGIPGLAVYSASKFYIDGITEALHLEWQQHDIHVTCVKPPVINTAMGAQVDAATSGKSASRFVADDVAAEIEKAADGPATARVMGSMTKVWYALDKFLPSPARRALIRRLVGG